MKLRTLLVSLVAGVVLLGSAAPALASNDQWHRGQRDYYYGTNNTVDVELSMHTWDTPATHVEGNMFINTLGANNVKAIDIISIKLWRCDSGGTNCTKMATWTNAPATLCLDTCGNPNYERDTDDTTNTQGKQFHVEAVYQLQWSNGNWSNNQDENSGTITP